MKAHPHPHPHPHHCKILRPPRPLGGLILITFHDLNKIRKNILKIARVETSKQQADIFTKPVTFTILEPLRKEIMGWLSLFKPKAKIEENDYANLCFLANILTLADC